MKQISLVKYDRTKNAETHKCVFCQKRFEADECRFDLYLDGWLCEDCIDYLRSRGEPITTIENNYF